MKDLFPKFIIESDNDLGDYLVISKCTFHKELVTDKDKVKGGGWFRFKDNTFTLYGESYDFGRATIEDIKKAIEDDKVFTNIHLTHSISNKFKFEYDTDSEIIKLN